MVTDEALQEFHAGMGASWIVLRPSVLILPGGNGGVCMAGSRAWSYGICPGTMGSMGAGTLRIPACFSYHDFCAFSAVCLKNAGRCVCWGGWLGGIQSPQPPAPPTVQWTYARACARKNPISGRMMPRKRRWTYTHEPACEKTRSDAPCLQLYLVSGFN